MARVKRKRKLKPNYIILVDGESEIIYLNLLKKQNIKVIPEIPKKKSLKDMYDLFKSKQEEADQVFWIIDLDVVIKENKLNDLKNYITHYKKNIIINNPCLEYWFYLHYKKRGNFNNTCKDVITQLKREDDFFKNYSKSSSDIEKLVTNLANKISIACDNAKNRECDLEQLVSCSQMNKIIEILN